MKSFIVLASLAAVVAAQSPAYGQCGGTNWTGPTTCVSGYTCTYSNNFYSQCVPNGQATGTTTKASTTKASTTSTKASTSTAPSSTGASCTFPSPSKTSSLSSPITIASGQTFDGANVRYDRGSGACMGQKEGGDSDAVFLLQSGATLQNVVIGANQAEGVHCLGSCTLRNVWFEDVCEDAITIKQTSGTSSIIGGGAKNADDKIVQHNGGGNVVIDGFCAQTFGKLYRSCGNCSTMYKRTVTIQNVIASSGSVLAGVNSNYGDVATIKTSTLKLTSVKSICDTYEGNDSGDEPPKLTSNTANANCVF